MIYILVVIFGAIIGSFLNVVILRIHENEKISNSRSRCPHCKQVLGVRDLIPLVSFILQFGKCRYCSQKVSWQYPLVELTTALLFLVAFLISVTKFNIDINSQFSLINFDFILTVIRDFIFISYLIVIFVYDLRWYLILDRITIPAMIIAIAFNIFLGFTWQSLAVGALIGFGFFAIQYFVSQGKWIGGGDLRLGALMGFMLGAKLTIVALFLSYVIGAVVSLFLVARSKKKFKSEVPFGTFLAIGTVITLLWGGRILDWYMGLL